VQPEPVSDPQALGAPSTSKTKDSIRSSGAVNHHAQTISRGALISIVTAATGAAINLLPIQAKVRSALLPFHFHEIPLVSVEIFKNHHRPIIFGSRSFDSHSMVLAQPPEATQGIASSQNAHRGIPRQICVIL